MSTIGEQKVRVEFNPSNSSRVQQYKEQTAVLINMCGTDKGNDPEQARLASLAQTYYEIAVMFAVKAVTSCLLLAVMLAPALAIECPVAGQPCKWISLSPQEEAMLLQERGILATAAEGRKVDLDAVSLYFRNKITAAPQGEVKTEPKKETQ